jgi:hypothetical protein
MIGLNAGQRGLNDIRNQYVKFPTITDSICFTINYKNRQNAEWFLLIENNE